MYFTVQLGLFRPNHFRINQDYNNRNRGDEQCIIRKCLNHIQMQQAVNSSLRTASRTTESRKQKERALGKQCCLARVKNKIDR